MALISGSSSGAVLPQVWCEWFSKPGANHAIVLCLVGLVSIPLGWTAWCFANIWIVRAKASSTAQGEDYCLLLSDGKLFSGDDYHPAPDAWKPQRWQMFTARGAGGSGDCCQWDFHALL